MRRYNLHFIILALSCLVPAGAFACSNPPGDAGDQVYNTTYNVMQYCNGTNWVAMGTHGAIAGDNLGSHAASDELNMGGFRIENVGPPTGGTHAATKDYVDTALGAIPAPATPNLAAVIAQGNSAGNSRITNVSLPSADSDAATKEYVDSVVGSASGGGCGHIPDCAEHGGSWGWNNGVWSCSRANYYAWGQNQYGQYGNGTTNSIYTPMLVSLNNTQPMKKLAMDNSHGCGIDENDMLWCWGLNSSGQLGLGNTTSTPETTPRAIGGIWQSVSAGQSHSCGIQSSGVLQCWGANGHGNLGVGDPNSRETPTTVSGGGIWKRVSAGSNHTCAINSSDAIRCWGYGSNGVLGDNGTSSYNTPRNFSAGGTWKEISAGGNHSCAIRSDDTLWCWGNNGNGQLGDNSKTNRGIAVQVHNGGTWKDVAVGSSTVTCGIKTDNTLWCWGRNSEGSVGDGTLVEKIIPTQIHGGGSWKDVEVGSLFACAIKSDDTLWCWGYNYSGALGLAHTTNQTTPQQVYGGGQWVHLALGGFSALAIPKVSIGGGGGGGPDTAAPAWQTNGDLPYALGNTAYSMTLVATDDSGSVTYSLRGSAPSWMTLNTSTGSITGTPPNNGNYVREDFTVRAADAAGNYMDRTFTIDVVCSSGCAAP